MKTLYLVRHAKASQSLYSLADIDRPLVERGYANAHFASNKLSKTGLKPGLMVSSPGIRALTTALIFARNLNYPASLVGIIESLYNAPVEKIVQAIHQFDDSIETAMLFGHNPSITNAAILLSGQYIEHVPTSGIVGIEFQLNHWKDINTKAGNLILFDFPEKD